MKKFLIILAIIITILVMNKEQKVIIPKESIRFRVIANSNTNVDQNIKKEIINDLSKDIIKNNNSIEEARYYLKTSIPKFEETVNNTLKRNNINNSFHINYGKNYFPKKKYKGIIYEEGEYESLVITIGDGKGKNFWCVLFPPICMIDTNNNEIEYKSLIKELIDRYF